MRRDDVEFDELDPKSKRLVAAARAGRSPTDADKRRVGAAVAAALAASAAGTATGVAAGKVVGGAAVARGLAALLVVASTGAGVAWWVHGRAAAPEAARPAVVAPPPAPTVTPLPPPAAEAPAPDDPLLAEVTLLRRAQKALAENQPGKALELAARHATLYPGSRVGVERDGLRVFALCALGRKAEAHAIAVGLLARAPRSPLAASLAESCAMK